MGNSEQIHIWQDRWLIDGPNLRRKIPSNIFSIPIKVADLIDSNSKAWKVDDIRMWFVVDDVDRIEQIHLPKRICDDSKICLRFDDGVLTIRAAYNIARQASILANTRAAGYIIWKHIWGTKVAPKIRVLWWRFASEIILKMSKLAGKKLNMDN